VPIIAIDLPVIYEDEGYEEKGESALHTDAIQILLMGLRAHFKPQSQVRVYSDLNLLYHPIKKKAYISPDVMVVAPSNPRPDELSSYRIGEDGPAPMLTAEVLSPRTAQQGDLSFKQEVLSFIKVREYLLVDPTGQFMEKRLLLRRLEADGAWTDVVDSDGGITSELGFRVIIDSDGKFRVVDGATGHKYLRADEAEEALQKIEIEKAQLEAEIACLKARSTEPMN